MNGSKVLMSFAVVMSLFGAGCAIGQQQPQGPPTGGVWFSPDRGTSWKQITVKLSSAGIGSFSEADIQAISFDPQDANAVYAGSKAHGLFYSYDGGMSWMQPKTMTAGSVQAVAVHPKDKCTIYVAMQNSILRSTDCSRSYEPLFNFESGEMLNSLTIDSYDNRIMFASAERGALFKSLDGGVSWKVAKRFDDRIMGVVVSPFDSRKLLVGLESGGIWRSEDKGETWTSLEENLKAILQSKSVRAMEASPVQENLVYVATARGLLKSVDFGTTWEEIPILTAPGSAVITSISADRKDANTIYYGTDKAFYRTSNAGANWEAIKLPTRRATGKIAVHPELKGGIYLGAMNFGQ